MDLAFNLLIGLFGLLLVAGTIYDVIAYRYSYEYTITGNLRQWSKDYPLFTWMFGFLFGLLIGHLYA